MSQHTSSARPHWLPKALALAVSLAATTAVGQDNNESLGDNAGSSISTGDNNVLLGDNAGASVSSGSENVLVGESAGTAITSGTDVVAIGAGAAGASSSTLVDSVLVGARAGELVTSSDNVFVGTEAGLFTTSGGDNVFIGEEAGQNHTTGDRNVFIGEDAGFNSTDADDNVAIGKNALLNIRASRLNVAIGRSAGEDMGRAQDSDPADVATRNVLVGAYAGVDMETGVANTLIGDNAGANSQTASFNTFIGFQAGRENDRIDSTPVAERNTALGAFAGYSNRYGVDNLWLGALADTGRWSFDSDGVAGHLKNGLAAAWNPDTGGFASVSANLTVNRSTVVGNNAAVADDNGVALGYRSLTDGDGAMALGATAQALHANSVAVGYGAQTRSANTMVLGNFGMLSIQPGRDNFTSLGTPSVRFGGLYSTAARVQAEAGSNGHIQLYADSGLQSADLWQLTAVNDANFTLDSFAGGSWSSVMSVSNTGDVWITGDLTVESDARRKTGIARVERALALVSQVDGYRYRWREDLGRGDSERIGFLAQEVQKVMPELVSEQEDGTLTVNYQGFVPVLTSAVRELRTQHQQTVESQQAEIDALRSELSTQKRLVAELLAAIRGEEQ